MKKYLLVLTLFFGIISFGYSQSALSDLKDNLTEAIDLVEAEATTIDDLTNKLENLDIHSKELEDEVIPELKITIDSLDKALYQALWDIDVAVDRMNDAEFYALDVMALNELLQAEVDAFEKKQTHNTYATIGNVTFSGIGAATSVYGFIKDNQTAAYTGIGIFAVSNLIYFIGDLAFDFW